jgi:hypothetical protein
MAQRPTDIGAEPPGAGNHTTRRRGRRCTAQRQRCVADGPAASWAACSRRTSTWMKAASNRWRVDGRQLLHRLGREGDRGGRLGDEDVGAVHAQVRAGRQVGHLAHRGARAQLRHALAVAVDLDLALGDDVEAVALVALAVQRVADSGGAATGAVHHLPQLHVAEALEEVQRAQQVEALGVQHLLQRPRGTSPLATRQRQRLRKASQLAGRRRRFLGQRLADAARPGAAGTPSRSRPAAAGSAW